MFWFRVIVLLFIPFGLVLSGFEMAALNRPISDVRKLYKKSSFGERFDDTDIDTHWGIVMSGMNIGVLLSALFVGFILDRLGRKSAQIIVILFAAVSEIGSVFALTHFFYSPNLLLCSTTMYGLYFGSCISIVPTYLGELSPLHLRRKISLLMDFCITAGFILGSILSLPQLFGNFYSWFIIFIVKGFLLSSQVFALLLCPDSPRYLLITLENEEESRQVLKSLGRTDKEIELEINEMKQEKRYVAVKATIWTLLNSRSLRKPLFLGCACSWMLNTSGAFAIYYVSNIAFTTSGFSSEISQYSTLSMGGFTVISYLLSVLLAERFGRRPLLLTGLGGMAISLSLVSVGLVHSVDGSVGWGNILAIVNMITTLTLGIIGPSSSFWSSTAEFFTQDYRATAVSVSTAFGRLGCVVSVSTYPLLLEYFGGYGVMFYSCLCFLYCIFVYFYIPETKNKTFQEISRLLGRNESSANCTPNTENSGDIEFTEIELHSLKKCPTEAKISSEICDRSVKLMSQLHCSEIESVSDDSY